MQGRIALITGASRGIGAAVARRFVREGAQVIAVARSQDALEALDDEIRAEGGSVILVPLDISDSERLEALAQSVSERFGKLDILVGNAGLLGEIAPVAHSAPEVWDKTISVNLTANMNLIRCFDTLLKASQSPRAMFVTSGVSDAVMPYWNGYAVSKAALDMMVKLYAAENVKTALKVNLVSPGQVRTRMHAQAFPGIDPDTITPPEDVTDIFVKLASSDLNDTGKKFYAQK